MCLMMFDGGGAPPSHSKNHWITSHSSTAVEPRGSAGLRGILRVERVGPLELSVALELGKLREEVCQVVAHNFVPCFAKFLILF